MLWGLILTQQLRNQFKSRPIDHKFYYLRPHIILYIANKYILVSKTEYLYCKPPLNAGIDNDYISLCNQSVFIMLNHL